ncbi:hypothetical protein Daus18300_003490 [Diaporthe australafricana]|uniref:non-specific serine/threonine protein kinase n=1 Tax=Diaporthe australafricana TaxID=127596 RepID=A0ABR3XEV9_9PEZI
MEPPPPNSGSSASLHPSSPPPPPPPPPLDWDEWRDLPPTTTAGQGDEIRYRRLCLDESGYEDVDRYRPGGFHPVDIGDKIAQYTVLHKLGSGGFATVWLVQSSDSNRPGYYALKILCADASGTKSNEQKVMRHLGLHDHPSVAKILDSFDITGPNDLTTSNIVFGLPDIQSPDAVCQLLGPIVKERLKLRNGSYSPYGPKRIVKNPDFPGFDIQMSSAAVMIVDLGEAFVVDSRSPRGRTGLGVPISSFPPEVCFGYQPSTGSDVWECACLFFEIFCYRPLFPMIWPVFEILIHHVVHSVGLLPLNWRGHFDTKYSNIENGKFLSTPEGAYFWFEARPEDGRGSLRDELLEAPKSELTNEQQEFLASLLQDMMARQPEERLPACEILRRIDAAAPLFGLEVAQNLVQFEKVIQDPDGLGVPPPPTPPEYDDSDSE